MTLTYIGTKIVDFIKWIIKKKRKHPKNYYSHANAIYLAMLCDMELRTLEKPILGKIAKTVCVSSQTFRKSRKRDSIEYHKFITEGVLNDLIHILKRRKKSQQL